MNEWVTYHYCDQDLTKWHDFAVEIFSLARLHIPLTLRVKKIEPIGTSKYRTPARRALNSVLDCSLLNETFEVSHKPWAASLVWMVGDLFAVDEFTAQ